MELKENTNEKPEFLRKTWKKQGRGRLMENYKFCLAASSFLTVASIGTFCLGILNGNLVCLLLQLLLIAAIKNPLEVGIARFFLTNQKKDASLSEVKLAVSPNIMNFIVVLLERDIRLMLWSFLFVIPGIVKSYEYRFIPYLLAEDPSISAEEAFLESKEMTDGRKWDMFLYDLSFLGWDLLGLFTFGLGMLLFSGPYKHCSEAEMYMGMKKSYGSVWNMPDEVIRVETDDIIYDDEEPENQENPTAVNQFGE